MEGILILLVLFLIGGFISGLAAHFRINHLRVEVDQLRASVKRLSQGHSPETISAPISETIDAPVPVGQAEQSAAEGVAKDVDFDDWQQTTDAFELALSKQPNPLIVWLQDHWMIALGGVCVALAGVFLVRYSIEQGLLGPSARFVASLLTGIALHIGAEFLRRRTGDSHPAFAALSGAGSITLYAALLAGMRLYDLIEPGTAFIGMALVAVITMAMAYIHGPVLAAFGILGAYLVPILTSTGGGQIIIALVYALIISASALLLLRYVYRPWLWLGFLTGAFGWWAISLGDSNGDSFRSIYLTALAYLIVAIPHFDWLLRCSFSLPSESYLPAAFLRIEDQREKQLLWVFLIVSVAYGITIFTQADYVGAWIVGLPLFALSFFIARQREQLVWLPWLLLIVQIGSWLLPQWRFGSDGWQLILLDEAEGRSFIIYIIMCMVATSVFSLWNWNGQRYQALWAAAATVGPFLFLTLGYLLTSRLLESWYWGLGTGLLALEVMIIATRSKRVNSIDSLVVWLFVAGHFGLALGASMVFNEASLTLAIAIQMISLAWIIRTFELPALDWLLKLVVGIVIIRLTFNPWLASYPIEIHWPLYSYGGSFLCALVGLMVLRPYPQIARWCEGAALHLFVLTIFAELRYQFHDGAVFSSEYTVWEACTYMALFAALGLVYYRRSLVNQTLGKLYRIFSIGLAVLALMNYLLIVAKTLDADAWIVQQISETPIANGLLAAYGVPIIACLLYYVFYQPRFKQIALVFSGTALFVFVSLQIRHLWTGTIDLWSPSTSDGELYTYSAVWLIIAIATMLAGSWRLGQDCYRAGVTLLAVVIVKLFLVDMSDLEGLLRVASFMGLGLSLLGVSYVHQKLTANQGLTDASTHSESRPTDTGGA